MREDLEEKIRELTEESETFERRIEEAQALTQSYKDKWVASEAEVSRLCNGHLDGER